MGIKINGASLNLFCDWLAKRGWPRRVVVCPEDFMILWNWHDRPSRGYPLQIGPTEVVAKHALNFLDVSEGRIFTSDAEGTKIETEELVH